MKIPQVTPDHLNQPSLRIAGLLRPSPLPSLFFRIFIYFEREKEGETSIASYKHPKKGWNPQPRHMP